jgi:hypothetical protein
LQLREGKYPPAFHQQRTPDGPISHVPELQIEVDGEAKEVCRQLLEPLQESWRLAHEAPAAEALTADPNRRSKFLKSLSRIEQDMEIIWKEIAAAMAPRDNAGKTLHRVGLWPAIVPSLVLPKLLQRTGHPESWLEAIVFYAFLLRHKQRAQRCLRLLAHNNEVQLEKELCNIGNTGWLPKDNPEWLLLEVDNDFCIRAEQAAVAYQIVSNESGNRLLQLIMGAGKTAVIVPMVVAALATGKYCVRVTVMSSLYMTNASDWQLKLGGLLDKRVYALACRRDWNIETYSSQILTMLEDIKRHGHFIVTVPEHRLSLENKVIELAWKGEVQKSIGLQQIVSFLELHGRDVLDESDELLHPKSKAGVLLRHISFLSVIMHVLSEGESL